MTDTAAKPWPVMSIDEAHAQLTAPGQRFELDEAVIDGIPTKVWKNAPPTLRDVLLNGRAFGSREFLVHEDERATFEAFTRAVITLAHQLQADGVKPGDRVALVMRNLPEWPVAFFAGAIVGAVVTPLNAWWTGPELEFGLADSGAKVALVDDERLERILEHLDACPDLARIYVTRAETLPADPRLAQLEDVIGPVNSWGDLPDKVLPDVALAPDDVATIFYTSGTTGKPKGALGTHRNLTANIMASACAGARGFLRRGEPIPEQDAHKLPPRAYLLVVPLFHVTGCNATLSPAINSGSKLVLMRKWEPVEAMGLIEREKVTNTGGVPTIAWQLIEHPARKDFDLSSLTTVAYGGAPSAPDLVRKIVETFPGSAPSNGWGMTETSATCTTNIGRDYEHRPDSCGVAPPPCELKIVDPADGVTELPVGKVGELWAKGPNIVKGYWNRPEATAETFVDGWVRTGDLAFLDEEGFCFIVDRAKDMLIRGGENVYCIEVENALYEHPAVMDAAVVGIPHKILGEEVGAVVQLKPGMHVTEDELRAHAASHLAAFKVPVKVLFMTEPLPRNANGKILKPVLREQFVS
ncbi:MAG TPA: fatty acid--CoA ligase [Brevundimonas sp.]|nr:fatty acid--CoA ligase [Brevundimonas sp.]